MKLLIANRGEIAVRIMRAAAELNIPTVAVFPEDDANALHTRKAEEAIRLEGVGAAAYLGIEQIIGVDKESNCDAIHPGYGFLAENTVFARRCQEEGLIFIGPRVEMLEVFGNKTRARAVAAAAGVPVLRGLDHVVSLKEARAFFNDLGNGHSMMIKAVGGGGGRGIRVVESADELEGAYKRCRSEALAAFGYGDVYVEEFIPRARHIEVQILGDLHGAIAHLGERECSVQRRFQKIIEVAPAPNLPGGLRSSLIDAAMRCASSVGYNNIGTFEFLVDVSDRNGQHPFAFMEVNARLQVEHTVTEEVTGVDIVQAQIRLAQGASIAELGLDNQQVAEPRGYAIQARVNMETIREDGSVHPSGGILNVYEPPSGPGVRTDGFGYSGYRPSLAFDSLLAKVIGHSSSTNFKDAITRTSCALGEFRIEGVDTNIPFLQNILAHEDFAKGCVHTRFIDEHIAELSTSNAPGRRYVEPVGSMSDNGVASARIDSLDPLALFTYDAQVKKSEGATADEIEESVPDLIGPGGSVGLVSPISGKIVSIDVAVDDEVWHGQQVAVIEAMKLEHVITADRSGIVRAVSISVGDSIREGYPIIFIEEADVKAGVAEVEVEEIDPDYIRSDLALMYERHSYTLDENRPEAVENRRKLGKRTPRENIARLLDDGSFQELGPLVVAAQANVQTEQWLYEHTPCDGVIMGYGSVNGDLFDETHSRVIVVHYDYSVLAGTQGEKGQYKQDRMYELAKRFRLPLVLFAEGGGGRAGDGGESSLGSTGIEITTFTRLSELSGLVPMVGVNTGRCFAGNTVMLACCDVIISTEDSTIGVGGPAMIDAGGLGVYTPEEVGPMSVQVPNGVVDILVKDDVEAVETAKKYLSYFQGPVDPWEAHDQRKLRHIIPENRLRMYSMRELIKTLVDKGSMLEVRKDFGIGMITALVRIEGRPMGLIANNPDYLGGAVCSDGADKGARFLQMCDAFDLPVLVLVDCPGLMVGPEHERTAGVRHLGRMFNTGANISVPRFMVVVRKAYGLGAQSMIGGSSMVPFMSLAWPTAEFAGMSIEGMVKLGSRKELAAIENLEERIKKYDDMVAKAYERTRAVNALKGFGVDDVIDPAETRSWIARGLKRLPPVLSRTEKKHPYIDTW